VPNRTVTPPKYGESLKIGKKQTAVIHSNLSEADLGLLMVHAADIFSKSDEDEFSRVLLGTYCVILARLSKGTLVTTAVLMEHDPSHLNTVSRRASKLVDHGLLERYKVINDNKRYEITFKVPDGLVEKLRRARRG
jgi:hypothetical protein